MQLIKALLIAQVEQLYLWDSIRPDSIAGKGKASTFCFHLDTGKKGPID